jgi:uncharacterized membrane protein (DUF4010 family)
LDTYELFASLGLALVAGLLVGVERQQSAVTEDKPEGDFIGGSRTYPLFALLGAVAVLVSRQLGAWVMLTAFVGVLALVGLSYAGEVFRGGDRGLTSEVALLLTFLLGALSMTEGALEPLRLKAFAVLSAAVIATLLLSVKLPLHAFIAKATKEDVLATMKFLIVAVVLLPLLPDRTMGPLDALNPFKVGLMITLIGGVSFVGYVAMRVLGPGRGLMLTGIVGGLVSSTAVTLTFSKRAKEAPAIASACALAIVLASTIMCVRVVVLVGVVNRAIVDSLVPPMGAMTVVSIGACFMLYRESRNDHGDARAEVKLSNPFSLGSAVKLGILFAIVLFVSKAATTYAGAGGTYLTGLLAGTTDVDAVTLSMADLSKRGLSEEVAVTTILISVASNTMVKGALAAALGGWALGKRTTLAFAASIAGGLAGVAWIWLR